MTDVLRHARLLEGRAAILEYLSHQLSAFGGEQGVVPALLIAHGGMGGSPAPLDTIMAVQSELYRSADEARRLAGEVMNALVDFDLGAHDDDSEAAEGESDLTVSLHAEVVANEMLSKPRSKKPQTD